MFVCTYSLFWCMTIQAPDPHLAVNHHWGFYGTFLRTNLLSKSYALSFTSLGRINMQLQNIRCLDDFSHFFQNRKSEFSTIRILTTYITKMQLHGPDELGILQYISKWARRTDYSKCSHVLSMLYSHMISTADRLLIVYDDCNNC